MLKHSLPKKAVILVVVMALVASLLSGCSVLKGTSVADYCVYIKDNELFITDFTEDGTHQLTTQLLRIDKNDIGDEQLEWFNELGWSKVLSHIAASFSFDTTRLTSDGKYVLYPDKLTWNEIDKSGSFSLYCRTVADLDSDPVKIDSNIISYLLTPNSTQLTYVKEKEDELVIYEYDLKNQEKVKIAAALDMLVANNGDKAYISSDGNLYLKLSGKDATKLDGNVDAIIHNYSINNNSLPDRIDAVYYLKNNTVYKRNNSEERVKLISDIKDESEIIHIYNNGSMYFLRSSEEDNTLLDYVNDSYAESDAAFTVADKPEKPRLSDYDTYDEWDIAYERYEEAYDVYRLSLEQAEDIDSRNEIRTELAARKLDPIYALYYFDGSAETLVSENVDIYDFKCSYGKNTPVIAYGVYKSSEFEKPDLEIISDYSELYSSIGKARHSAREAYVAVSGTPTVIDDCSYSFGMDGNDETLYYINNDDDMYSSSLKDGKLETPVFYSNDVYDIFGFNFNDEIVYFKDYSNGAGDLYIGQNKVASDVSYSSVFANSDSCIIYSTDYTASTMSLIVDGSLGHGELNIYENGESVKITNDFYDPQLINRYSADTAFSLLPSGAVVYFSDYDSSSFVGQLSIYKGGENEVIAEDVTFLARLYATDSAFVGEY